MANETDLVLLVVAGSLVFFLFVVTIIAFTALYSKRLAQKDNELKMSIKNRELAVLRATIETQTSEREKIALNLHDEVGPLLSTMKLKFFQNQKDFKEGNMTEETFKSDRAFLDSVIQIVRKVSHDLSPQYVTKFGIVRAIENFVNGLDGIDAVQESSVDELVEIPSHISDNLYYITTELVNNLIKHDQIKQLRVTFDIIDNKLILTINHDGIGYSDEEFDIFEQKSKGLGLTSIKHRAIVIGGELHFRKSPETPRIEIVTPLTLQ